MRNLSWPTRWLFGKKKWGKECKLISNGVKRIIKHYPELTAILICVARIYYILVCHYSVPIVPQLKNDDFDIIETVGAIMDKINRRKIKSRL